MAASTITMKLNHGCWLRRMQNQWKSYASRSPAYDRWGISARSFDVDIQWIPPKFNFQVLWRGSTRLFLQRAGASGINWHAQYYCSKKSWFSADVSHDLNWDENAKTPGSQIWRKASALWSESEPALLCNWKTKSNKSDAHVTTVNNLL